MVAEFVKLKLQFLGNTFNRTPRQNVGVLITFLVCVALAVAAIAMLLSLVGSPAMEVRTIVVVGGSTVVLAYVLVPLISGVPDTLDPRRFALFGIRPAPLALSLAVAALVSVPLLLTLLVAAFTVPVWSQNPGLCFLAIVAALLGVATCLLISRITSLLAALVLSTQRARETAGLITLLVLVLVSPAVILWFTVNSGDGAEGVADAAGNALGWTPLGAAWSVPGDVASGAAVESVVFKALIAVAFVIVLWLAWRGLVARALVSAQREHATREHANLGWFARTPSTRSGAVAARSLTYWARDARYPVPVIGVFGFLLVVFIAFVIAGIPLTFLVLLTIPALCATLAFSVHNDVALDNSAVWMHVSASKVGLADRVGRMVPVLAMGIPLIAIGSVLTAYLVDNFDALPALLGVSTVLLFAGLGVGNLLSSLFPYPAVRPGDGPFSQPQVGGGTGVVVQIAFVMLLAILAAPSVYYALVGLTGDPSAFWPSLWWGAGTGLVVIVAGTLIGGAVFDRRSPDILAAALRN